MSRSLIGVMVCSAILVLSIAFYSGYQRKSLQSRIDALEAREASSRADLAECRSAQRATEEKLRDAEACSAQVTSEGRKSEVSEVAIAPLEIIEGSSRLTPVTFPPSKSR